MGAEIPSVGLGTWQAEPGVVGEAVIFAIKAGYRHIDCAWIYRNEKEIGLALKQLFDGLHSNFSTKKLEGLLNIARVPPAVNQVECHPVWQQTKLRIFCQSKGVLLTAYSPLGSPGTKWIEGNVLTNPVIIEVAEKLGKTPAQVALRWGIQMGNIVLPKSTKESRIQENFDVFDWSIPDNLFAKFSTIQQARLGRGDFFVSSQGLYQSVEEIWDGEI